MMKKAILTKGILLLAALGVHAFGQDIKTIEVNVKDKYCILINDTTLNPIRDIDSLMDLYEGLGVDHGPFFSDATLNINLKNKKVKLTVTKKIYGWEGELYSEELIVREFEYEECKKNGSEYTFIFKIEQSSLYNTTSHQHYYFDTDKDLFMTYVIYGDNWMSISKPVELSMNSK
jgi:hypothetical protein